MATINEMRQVATQIENETQVGGNTASRVGGLFNDVVDKLEDVDGIAPLDNVPTNGSVKGVTSNGVYNALQKYKKMGESFEFDFSTGSTAAYASRSVNHIFTKGSYYKIDVLTEDATINTYFSIRDNSGTALQSNLLTGKGQRSGVIACNVDGGAKLYMTYSASGPSISYDVKVTNVSDEVFKEFNENLGAMLQFDISSAKVREPFTFSNVGKVITADGTEGDSQWYYRSNVEQLKGGECVSITAREGSNGTPVIILTNSEGTTFTPVVFGSSETPAKKYNYYATTDCYVILQYANKTGTPYVYRESARLVNIENTLTNEKVKNDTILVSSDNAISSVTFAKNGHVITPTGSIGESQWWSMSNIFTLYKNQTIELIASATYEGATMIALSSTNDEETAVYTPVVFSRAGYQKLKYTYTASEDCYIRAQYYGFTSFAIINDSERIVNIENELVKIQNQYADSMTAEYVKEERERISKEIAERLNDGVLLIAFNTDQHFGVSEWNNPSSAYNPQYVMRGIKSMADMAAKLPFDCIVLGGDVAGYDGRSSSTVNGILEGLNLINEPFTSINTPFIHIVGNHDAFQNNGNVKAQGMYNTLFKRSKGIKGIVHSGTDNCDCYFDDDDYKVRYIFVDTYSRNTRTESYATFLSNALSSMGNDYKCIIFSHNPLTNEFAGTVQMYNPSGNLVDAFANPTDLHTTINPYASKIIACICGHSHADVHAVSSSNILYIETTTAAPHTINHFGDIPYQKTKNTVTETAFDVFVINLTDQTIEALRYGQGTNRKWKYKGTGQGLISYTNYLSGECSVPSVTLTFTNNGTDITASVGADKKYEVYLELGKEYTISCSGYTLDTSSVTLSQNTSLDLTLTAES